MRNVLRDAEERERVRLEAQAECDQYNSTLTDRAARRREKRELQKTGRTISLSLPWVRSRAARRHLAPLLDFEPDPNAKWRGGRMFLQRDKKRAEGRV